MHNQLQQVLDAQEAHKKYVALNIYLTRLLTSIGLSVVLYFAWSAIAVGKLMLPALAVKELLVIVLVLKALGLAFTTPSSKTGTIDKATVVEYLQFTVLCGVLNIPIGYGS
jgi:hypothetical protein